MNPTRAIACVFVAAHLACTIAGAQTPLSSAFTYQGHLKIGELAYTGTADLQFSLYDAPGGGTLAGGPITEPACPVTDGLFTLPLNFGSAPFSGQERWLEIAVRTPAGSAGSYTTLSPRQRVAPAPHALFALNANTPFVYSGANAVFAGTGNVGIGVSTPSGTLDVGNASTTASATAIVGRITSGSASAGSVAVRGVHSGTGAAGFGVAGEHAGAGVGVIGTSVTGIGVRAETLDGTAMRAQALGDGDALVATAQPNAFASQFLGGRNYFEGNVGIGTTTPVGKLHVVGDAYLSSGFKLAFLDNTSFPVGGISRSDFPGSTGMTIADSAMGNVRLCTSPSFGVSIERMRVTPEGNVGIGTTTPVAKLHVVGDAYLSSGFKLAFLDNTSFPVGGINRSDFPGSTGMTIADSAMGNIRLCTGTSFGVSIERMRVTPAGNVGIGATSPQKLLQIGDDTIFGSTGMMRMASRTSTGGPEHRVWDIGVPQTGTDLSGAGYCFVIDDTEFGADPEFVVRYATGNVGIGTVNPGSFKLAVNGTAANSTGSWSVFSDARLKTNICDLPAGALDRMLQLRGRTFEYTRDAQRTHLAGEGAQTGFIAQEVQQVFPEWVSESPDGYLYVTERGTTALMVEALRDLRAEKDAEIELLRSEVTELRAMMQHLIEKESSR